MFSTPKRKKSYFLLTLNLSSAYAFNLNETEILYYDHTSKDLTQLRCTRLL